MKTDTKQKLNAVQVMERLGAHYPSGAYAFLSQVRNSTGYSSEVRTADAMAMSLWPSRGLYLMGFEVKVSRSDWQVELMQPAKAEALAAYCEYWYLVVGDESIVHAGELPKTWGLLVPHKDGLREAVKPTKLKPKPMDRETLAGIMRNVTEQTVAKGLIEGQIRSARDAGKDWGKNEIERLKKELADERECISTFEKHSGVHITRWPSENKEIGQAVRQVLDGKHLTAAKKIVALTTRAEKIVAFLKGENVDVWDM